MRDLDELFDALARSAFRPATCCRGCLAKWHGIERGRALTDEEQAHVVATIMRWLDGQISRAP